MMTTENLREELARQIKHIELEIREKQKLVLLLRTTWLNTKPAEPTPDDAIFKGLSGMLPTGKLDA